MSSSYNTYTEIGGDFDCSNNNLTSLEFSQKIINGFFNFMNNKIDDIKSEIIKNSLNCLSVNEEDF